MSRMQDKKNQPTTHVYVGIDVSKLHLDVFIRPLGRKRQFNNDIAGIKKLIRQCRSDHVHLVAMEATGRYHRLAHQMLHEANIDVAVVNPYRSRKFADAIGKLAKTDPIDAKVLADFAALLQPKPSQPPSRKQRALSDLNVARRQVLAEIGTLKRQSHETDHPLATRHIRARIKMCERHKFVLEQEIQNQINAQENLKHRFDILTSIPGVGPATATTMITDLAELGQANSREIAALAGLAPMNRDSGARSGPRIIRGGRKYVRNMLYMCAVGQSRREGFLGSFYRHLIKQGKNPKVALTAVMRKLVILANTLIAENRHWQPTPPVK